MAQATTTTLGEIILAGDLAGSDANNPTLRPSGVNPGYYSPVMGAHIDNKGRITWAGIPDYDEEIAPLMPTASKVSKGLVQIGNRIVNSYGVISIPYATTSVQGIVAIGSGLQFNMLDQVEPIVPEGDEATKGIVQIGSNINVTAGVISRVGLEDATTSSKGMIQISTDQGLSLSSGIVSAIAATPTDFGLVRPATGITGELYWETGTSTVHLHATSSSLYGLIFGYTGSYLNIDGAGELTCNLSSFPIASAGTFGFVKIGSGFSYDVDGKLHLGEIATSSVKGIVQIGSNIDVASGVISVKDATTSDKGIFSVYTGGSAATTILSFSTAPGYQEYAGLRFGRADDATLNYGCVKSGDANNISIVDGDINIGSNIPQKNTVNEFTGAQVVTPVIGTYAASYTPEFASSNIIDLTLTGNITINNPSSVNFVAGGKYTIVLRQDATGGRLLTSLGSKFKTNETITLSTAANAIDVLNIIATGANDDLWVIFNKGYA